MNVAADWTLEDCVVGKEGRHFVSTPVSRTALVSRQLDIRPDNLGDLLCAQFRHVVYVAHKTTGGEVVAVPQIDEQARLGGFPAEGLAGDEVGRRVALRGDVREEPEVSRDHQ